MWQSPQTEKLLRKEMRSNPSALKKMQRPQGERRSIIYLNSYTDTSSFDLKPVVVKWKPFLICFPQARVVTMFGLLVLLLLASVETTALRFLNHTVFSLWVQTRNKTLNLRCLNSCTDNNLFKRVKSWSSLWSRLWFDKLLFPKLFLCSYCYQQYTPSQDNSSFLSRVLCVTSCNQAAILHDLMFVFYKFTSPGIL